MYQMASMICSMKKELPPSRVAEQFVVRFPDGMRDQIADAAKEAGRSMNAEIVHRLQLSFEQASEASQVTPDLWARVSELEHLRAKFQREYAALQGQALHVAEEIANLLTTGAPDAELKMRYAERSSIGAARYTIERAMAKVSSELADLYGDASTDTPGAVSRPRVVKITKVE